MDDGRVGVYVHVPFCERICPYCDFPVVAARRLAPEVEGRYAEALVRELAARAPAFAGRELATVYLGGGTPSLLAPETLAALLAAIRASFPGRPAEVTLEVNPSTVERERLPGFREAGVDRLSVGVQSFDDATLKRLGRAHRAEEARATLRAARRAGFANLSLDLIVGAPGQEPGGARADVREALAVEPAHVSAYGLTLEPGTPFARAAARGALVVPDDDAQADALEAVADALEAAGLFRYEVSSYARPGREAQHNQRYWLRQPVLGLGMGAHSSEPAGPGRPHGRRTANERSLEAWLARVAERPAEPPGVEELPGPVARGEAMFLALRRREGVRAVEFAEEFGAPPRRFYAGAIDELVAAGLLREAAGGDLSLTARGWLLSDGVFERFVGAGPV